MFAYACSFIKVVVQATSVDWASRQAARKARFEEEEMFQTFRDVNSSDDESEDEEGKAFITFTTFETFQRLNLCDCESAKVQCSQKDVPC